MLLGHDKEQPAYFVPGWFHDSRDETDETSSLSDLIIQAPFLELIPIKRV